MSYFVRRLKLNNFIIIFHCSQQTTFSAIQGIIECNTLFSSDSFLPIRFLFYFGNTVMFQLFAALWITRALVALLVLLLDTSQPNERQQYAVQCIFSPPVEHNGASCFLFHFILVIFYQMCYALQGIGINSTPSYSTTRYQVFCALYEYRSYRQRAPYEVYPTYHASSQYFLSTDGTHVPVQLSQFIIIKIKPIM